MKKSLVLIRHAHRDTSIRSLDNGLSEKGFKQAKRIRAFALTRFSRSELSDLKVSLLSSPKRRCRETLLPLSETWGIPVQNHPLLDEQSDKESFEQLNQRVQNFMKWWIEEASPLNIVCSHGDWLPLAVYHTLGTAVEFKKGGWLELEWEMGRGHLRWYIPTFKHFFSQV